jgi:hypothetical protein
MLLSGDGVFLSATSWKANDGGTLTSAETARGASDADMRIGRTDDDGAPVRCRCFSFGVGRNNDGDGRDAQISKPICFVQSVGTEIDSEAVSVGVRNGLPVGKIGQHIEVREGESAPVSVRIGDGSQCRLIDRRFVVARKIARNIVPPQCTRRQCPDGE